MRTQRLTLLTCAGILGLLLGTSASAQTDLGGQRIGTSSGTFLKIGIDARGAGMAGTFNALVQGPTATFLNPAGIASPTEGRAVQMSYVNWPADIDIGAISYSQPVRSLGGHLGFGLMFLGTDFEETAEFYPAGTGRTVTYSDFLGTLSFSRLFTDRLSVGVSAKYMYEDMGSGVGGPTASAFLFDAGTCYALGYRNARLAITLSHFGPDIDPSGDYVSNVNQSNVSYTAYAPPTMFQLGFTIDAIHAERHRMSTAVQVIHPADQSETLRLGAEYWIHETYALRTGYDFAADELAFAAGVGFRLHVAGYDGTLDYAYTEGGNLTAVHRWSLGFAL